MRYIICAGAYYQYNKDIDYGGVQKANASPETHDISFFRLWLAAIEQFTKPEAIFITDSHSELMPQLIDAKLPIVWHRLTSNPGHSHGWLEGVVNGACYCLSRGADFVYVEQDCIIYGPGIIENIFNNRKDANFIFGGPYRWALQQSFFLIRHKSLEYFIKQITAEDIHPMEKLFHTQIPEYHYMDVGVGRDRPIPYQKPFWYAQHLTEDELSHIKLKLSPCPSPSPSPPPSRTIVERSSP